MKRSFTSQALHKRTSGKSRLTETAKHEDNHHASPRGLRGPNVKGRSNITPYFLLESSLSGSRVANDPPNHGIKAKATPVDGPNVVKANRFLLESRLQIFWSEGRSGSFKPVFSAAYQDHGRFVVGE